MAKAKGRELNEKWEVGALQALYSESGTWFHLLESFPGALFDPNGYVLFETKRAYETCSHLRITQELNVPGGIVSIPGYVKMTDSGR